MSIDVSLKQRWLLGPWMERHVWLSRISTASVIISTRSSSSSCAMSWLTRTGRAWTTLFGNTAQCEKDTARVDRRADGLTKRASADLDDCAASSVASTAPVSFECGMCDARADEVLVSGCHIDS